MSADKMIVLTLRDGTSDEEFRDLVKALREHATGGWWPLWHIESVQVRDFEPLVKDKG